MYTKQDIIIDGALTELNNRFKRPPYRLSGYFSTHGVHSEQEQRDILDIMIGENLIDPVEGLDVDVRRREFRIIKKAIRMITKHRSHLSFVDFKNSKRNLIKQQHAQNKMMLRITAITAIISLVAAIL